MPTQTKEGNNENEIEKKKYPSRHLTKEANFKHINRTYEIERQKIGEGFSSFSPRRAYIYMVIKLKKRDKIVAHTVKQIETQRESECVEKRRERKLNKPFGTLSDHKMTKCLHDGAIKSST